MKTSEILSKIEPFIGNVKTECEATVNCKMGNETVYLVEYSTKQRHPPIFMSLTFNLNLNVETILEMVNKHSTLDFSEEDILVFVKRKNLEIIPYLKMFSQTESDYDKIVELLYKSRGQVLLERFDVK